MLKPFQLHQTAVKLKKQIPYYSGVPLIKSQMLPALNLVTRRQRDDSSDSPFIRVLYLRLWTRWSNKWLLITQSFQLIHFLIFFLLSVILNCVSCLSTPPVLLRLYFRIILCFNKDISLEARAALVKIRWYILKHKHFSRNLNFYFSILLLATNLTQSQLTWNTLWFHRSLIHKKSKSDAETAIASRFQS